MLEMLLKAEGKEAGYEPFIASAAACGETPRATMVIITAERILVNAGFGVRKCNMSSLF